VVFWEAVTLVLLAAGVWQALRNRQPRVSAPPPEMDALYGEIARLRDRVEVLERIATDQPRRLSQQIEDLRS